VPSEVAQFIKRVASLAIKAVVSHPLLAYEPGDSGYADCMIVAIHGLSEYLDHSYRCMLDVLYEMPRIDRILGLQPDDHLRFLHRLCAQAATENADLENSAAALGGSS
jgi:hypothetical protein